ncbi:tRNA synthetases class I (E and Q), catalytic domain protein, partial [Chlamydia psittaci 06-1683]
SWASLMSCVERSG